MIRTVVVFLFNFILALPWLIAGEPYCNVRTYDERDGLSQRAVKQVVQDDNGVMWVATWNGLNRFDGYDFRCIRPGLDDNVRRYSSRIRDIKLGTRGMLWCRIDDRIVRFDVNTYQFHDSHSQLEARFGSSLRLRRLNVTVDGVVVAALDDGRYVTLPDSDKPEIAATVSDTCPDVRFRPSGGRKIKNIPGYDNNSIVYSQRCDDGSVWIVTDSGEISYAPDERSAFRMMARIDVDGKILRYGTTDNQGNVWLYGNDGLHCVTMGTAPYVRMNHADKSMMRTSYRDSMGRVWMSWSDDDIVTVSDSSLSTKQYVGADGKLKSQKVRFGMPVYCIFETSPGVIWFGVKPGGLYRLSPQPSGNSYNVEHFRHVDGDSHSPAGESYYDGLTDAHGRLWLATLGNGLEVVCNPKADKPVFVNLSKMDSYPSTAMSVRRLVNIGDSLIIAATTGGLLSVNIPEPFVTDSIRYTLHVSEPDRPSSLGNIATMDAVMGYDGSLYVATESDGVDRLISREKFPDGERWDFASYHFMSGSNLNVALSVVPYGKSDSLLVTGLNAAYLLDPKSGYTRIYGDSYWHGDMRFSEAAPMCLDDGRWLLGLENGAVLVDFDRAGQLTDNHKVMFNTVAISGRRDSIIPPSCTRVILKPHERDVTLRFAALCYLAPNAVNYEFKVNDEEWIPLGNSRLVTFAGLTPGEYNVTVRSSDTYGQWLDNDRTIILEVVPTFWETGFAKLLYVLATLAVVGLIVWTVIYVRRIKRLQRETLEAHLRLMESRAYADRCAGDEDCSADRADKNAGDENIVSKNLSEDDRKLMDSLIEYIEGQISNPSVSVDDMAMAVAVSRSGLTRKMKSLMGVTPGEFLRETRLTRASTLLLSTSKSIKEIAAECGFSDMNYFGKCFKASRGVTPGAFRKERSEN